MRYELLGRHSGLRVSEIAYGTALYGTGWGYGSEAEDARKLFDRYLEAGGNVLDTSDSYQFGQSETILGDFIQPVRDEVVVATKYSGGYGQTPSLGKTGNNRKAMIHSVEQSLKRLKTDRIDLFWVHHADNVTPMEEILRGLDDLVRSGKILYAGLSNFPAWRVSRGALLADLRGWAPLVAMQCEYSLVERTADHELLPMAEALGLAAVLWSPLAGGLLTGKYRVGEQGRLQGLGRVIRTEKTERDSAVVDTVIAIAKEHERSPAEIALAWVRETSKRSTNALIPIIGPRTLEQLENNLRSLEVTLSEDQFQRLEAVSTPSPTVPFEVNRETLPRVSGGKFETTNFRAMPIA